MCFHENTGNMKKIKFDSGFFPFFLRFYVFGFCFWFVLLYFRFPFVVLLFCAYKERRKSASINNIKDFRLIQVQTHIQTQTPTNHISTLISKLRFICSPYVRSRLPLPFTTIRKYKKYTMFKEKENQNKTPQCSKRVMD